MRCILSNFSLPNKLEGELISVSLKLNTIANNNKIRFTRYADDIVFSGVDKFPTEIKDQISDLFKATCWKLSREKEYFAESPMRLKVHGLLVHGEKARLTKGYRNKIRTYKHLLNAGKIRNEDLGRIVGHVKYAESVDKLQLLSESAEVK